MPNSVGPRSREDVMVTPFLDSCVVVDPLTDEAHMLNASAAFVLSCCDGATDETAIARELADSARVPLEIALSDVRTCLAQLRGKKLVHD
ncbi:MAG: PqqD family protein [Myxococcales bacterium]|nr:PqqD family protein [Myxococcales bacterium]